MKTASQKFWRYISPSKPALSHLLEGNRDVLREDDIANEFNCFFPSVFESVANDVDNYTLEGPADRDGLGMVEIEVLEEGYFSLLLDLEVNLPADTLQKQTFGVYNLRDCTHLG